MIPETEYRKKLFHFSFSPSSLAENQVLLQLAETQSDNVLIFLVSDSCQCQSSKQFPVCLLYLMLISVNYVF